MRHALALHENRKAMKPEVTYPRPDSLQDRSFIQAWFVGAHMDLGGSKTHDGLSLYPLQWILEESRSIGLILGFDNIDGRQDLMIDPLSLIFPQEASHHEFKTYNNVTIRMTDMRSTHALKDGHHERYRVKLNDVKGSAWRREPRRVFADDSQLNHYFPEGKFEPTYKCRILVIMLTERILSSFWNDHSSFSVLSVVLPLPISACAG